MGTTGAQNQVLWVYNQGEEGSKLATVSVEGGGGGGEEGMQKDEEGSELGVVV